jgi:hypothetical protein
MLIHPKNFIKNYELIENDEKLRMLYINEIGENGMERKDLIEFIKYPLFTVHFIGEKLVTF